MNISQLKEKIQELEVWLVNNPNSTERSLIESDLYKIKTILKASNE